MRCNKGNCELTVELYNLLIQASVPTQNHLRLLDGFRGKPNQSSIPHPAAAQCWVQKKGESKSLPLVILTKEFDEGRGIDLWMIGITDSLGFFNSPPCLLCR